MIFFALQNGDAPLHIASAMGRKKLTKILLASGSRTNSRNHQNETPMDISVRKGFNEITELLKNPPVIVSPIQRDEMRASKYKSASSGPSSNNSKGKIIKRNKEKSDHSDKKSGGGSSGGHGPSHRQHSRDNNKGSRKSGDSKNSQSKSHGNNTDVVPNWSPYGCHYHPNPEAFPPPKIDSLPQEPLRSGELYYLDLAGNIHKVSYLNKNLKKNV